MLSKGFSNLLLVLSEIEFEGGTIDKGGGLDGSGYSFHKRRNLTEIGR